MSDEIEIEEEVLQKLTSDLVSASSENPPGDVTEATSVAVSYLRQQGIRHQIVSTASRMHNIIARIDGESDKSHLVMNAHLDTFPNPETELHDVSHPRSYISENAVVGLGSCDMKGGAAAFLSALTVLNARRSELRGRVSLCLVCDEETFGPHGSRALLRRYPELYGTAMLSTEPSSLGIIEYGERGLLWGIATFRGRGGHGSTPNIEGNPIEAAAEFIGYLRDAISMRNKKNVMDNGEGRDGNEKDTSPADEISLNIGKVYGGLKMNMQPRACRVEIDVRIPRGVSSREMEGLILDVTHSHGGTFETVNAAEPNASDPSDPLFTILRDSVRSMGVGDPNLEFSVGCTDTRLWRAAGVPAAVYGPDPAPMAHTDEYISKTELTTVTKVHTLAALRYLSN